MRVSASSKGQLDRSWGGCRRTLDPLEINVRLRHRLHARHDLLLRPSPHPRHSQASTGGYPFCKAFVELISNDNNVLRYGHYRRTMQNNPPQIQGHNELHCRDRQRRRHIMCGCLEGRTTHDIFEMRLLVLC
ncbi:hypothetical protein ACLOJK_035284 [Asimina triloba]